MRRITATNGAVSRGDAFSLDLSGLGLTDVQLRALQPAISALDLVTFDVSDNQLAVLPDVIGELTHLISLNVSNNQLTKLPKSIGNLTALISFHVLGNELKALPRAIGKLTALIWLRLEDNQLSSLPEAIGKLTALTCLDVSGNDLTSLPESIGNLTALTTLGLSDNLLDSLPESIENLTALVTLDVSDNPLSAVPDGSMVKITTDNIARPVLGIDDLYDEERDELIDAGLDWDRIERVSISGPWQEDDDGEFEEDESQTTFFRFEDQIYYMGDFVGDWPSWPPGWVGYRHLTWDAHNAGSSGMCIRYPEGHEESDEFPAVVVGRYHS